MAERNRQTDYSNKVNEQPGLGSGPSTMECW